LFAQAFCKHRQVAAEGFLFVFGRFGQFLTGTCIYWLIIGHFIILPISPKSAPDIAAWRSRIKGYEPKGIEKYFLYASIM
jgi:hypothetical protein